MRGRPVVSIAVLLVVVLARALAAAPPDPPAILVSRQLLKAQALQVCDVVLLSAEPSGARAREFRIVGSYEPTPDPGRLGAARRAARPHLPGLLGLGRAAAGTRSTEPVSALGGRA